MKKHLIKIGNEEAKRLVVLSILLFTSFLSLLSGSSNLLDEHDTGVVQQSGRTVSGKITDTNDEPLPGVTVMVQGANRGTVADANGNFSLPNVSGSDILQFSFVGMARQEVVVGDQTRFNIVMREESQRMDDLVVVGYQTMRRSEVTGAISSVSSSDLRDVPLNSVEQALTGRMAGVLVTTSEGTPDAEIKIRVRGGGSITQDNSPIYVIDGIQVEEGLQGLSVNDIESIDILKDASSSSIYGARGANGVVIVTTKKGVAGRTKVTYDLTLGFDRVARKMDVLDTYEYLLYQDEKSRDDTNARANFLSTYGDIFGEDKETYLNWAPIDWQDELFGRTGIKQIHNIGVSGGKDDTQFNISYNRSDITGITELAGYKRDLLSARFNHAVSPKLRLTLNTTYSEQVVDGAGVSSSSTSTYNLLRNIIKYQPLITGDVPYDEHDEDYYLETGATNFALINPIALNRARYQQSRSGFLSLSGTLQYRIMNDLTFRSVIGYTTSYSDRDNFDSEITPQARYAGERMGMVRIRNSDRKSLSNSNTLSYVKRVGRDHRINALLGQETYERSDYVINTNLKYFPKGVTAEKALSQLSLGEPDLGYPRTTVNESRILSFFSRVNYSYLLKYYLTFSLRADGSSKFAPADRWGYFPAASFAWQVSRENFMKEVDFVSNVKVRGGYGHAGNNRIADYLYLTTYESDVYYFLNKQYLTGYRSSSLANQYLKWETTVSRNLGLDFTLKGIDFSFDIYSNNALDLLINTPIPSTSGFTRQLQNVASTNNRGLEIQLQGTPIEKKDFSWDVNFNIAFNRNEVLKISGWQDEVLFASGALRGNNDYILKERNPVGLMYGYVSDGFYTLDDFDYDPETTIYTLKEGVPDASGLLGVAQPGSMRLLNLNGDSIIDPLDQQVIGNANPKFSGGLNQQFRYKNLDFSVFVNFVYGNDVFNASKVEFTNGYSMRTNMLGLTADRWRTVDENGERLQYVTGTTVRGVSPEQIAELNKDAKFWIPQTSAAGAFLPTSWAIEDGSFLRLNNVTLGYTFPESMVKKIKLNSLRVYFTANNLAVFTRYSGSDPEVDTRRATPLTPSVDYSAYPRSRSYVFGLNLSL